MRKGYGRVYAGILFIILVIGIIIYGVLKYAKKEVDSEQFETIKTDMLDSQIPFYSFISVDSFDSSDLANSIILVLLTNT